MIHFVYLIVFALLVTVAFGAFTSGDLKTKVRYSVKLFVEFIVISLALAWLFYFIPW
ncbi:MAG: hypothetical protein IPM63_03070 [Acidobacteriota bacterium]|nr:MAG: hypothetical protein IPM63_03070 [Acidobacteriota bacterium]